MTQIILASGSKARHDMLRKAAVIFDVICAQINEQTIMKDALKNCAEIEETAQILADRKALDVSNKNPEALVIGSDQILECGGEIFSKAKDKDEARTKLLLLRGQTHHLFSAVSIALGGKVIWQYTDKAELTMHDFSAEFLDRYIAAAGDALTSCVGGYAIEEAGINLFKKIEGDTFTILGMPLLPLLNELRKTHGAGL
jgi:septum formation protein